MTANGLVEFCMSGSETARTVTPLLFLRKVLVPQKTYKVQKIKDTVEISESNGAAKIDKIREG